MVIQNIVELTPELQAEALGELEGLIEVGVKVPEARPEELVPHGVGAAIGRVRAAHVV